MKERKESGNAPDQKRWIEDQIDFLSSHTFLTATSRMLMSVSPDEQIRQLREYSDKSGKPS